MQTHSAQNTTQTREYTAAGIDVYKNAVQSAMELKWNITMSDADVLAFKAKTYQTMSRWEDDVNVFISEKDGTSTITVRSTLGHDPNVKHINEFLSILSDKLR
jgi:hypothetical protein